MIPSTQLVTHLAENCKAGLYLTETIIHKGLISNDPKQCGNMYINQTKI